jgi:carbon-monoxide dehydrogenase medium subunit
MRVESIIRAEDAIRGEKIDGEVIRKTAEEAVREISPITDVRSTAQYRAQVNKVLVTRLIELAIEQSDGE